MIRAAIFVTDILVLLDSATPILEDGGQALVMQHACDLRAKGVCECKTIGREIYTCSLAVSFLGLNIISRNVYRGEKKGRRCEQEWKARPATGATTEHK